MLKRKEADEMQKADVANLTIKPWASPIVLYQRKTEGFVFVSNIDYLALLQDALATPVQERMSSLASWVKHKYFQLSTQTQENRQTRTDDTIIDRTAFVTHHGLINYTYMPLGLKIAPTTFQFTVVVIHASVEWQLALVFIDDIMFL